MVMEKVCPKCDWPLKYYKQVKSMVCVVHGIINEDKIKMKEKEVN